MKGSKNMKKCLWCSKSLKRKKYPYTCRTKGHIYHYIMIESDKMFEARATCGNSCRQSLRLTKWTKQNTLQTFISIRSQKKFQSVWMKKYHSALFSAIARIWG